MQKGKGTKRKSLCLSFGNPKNEIYMKHCLNSTRKIYGSGKNSSQNLLQLSFDAEPELVIPAL